MREKSHKVITRSSLKLLLNLSDFQCLVKRNQLISLTSSKRKKGLSSRKLGEIKCCNRKDKGTKASSRLVSLNQPPYKKLIAQQLSSSA